MISLTFHFARKYPAMAPQTPPAAPAARNMRRYIAGLLSTEKYLTVAAVAMAPMKICPSAPIFQMSIVKESMTAMAAMVRGIAFTMVSLMP